MWSLNNELNLCSNFPQFLVGSKEQETEAVSEKEMRLAEEFWHCVSLCPPADSPHNPPTGLLSAPPTGGALVLGGICVTNFTLFPLPTRCFTVSFLCLSVRCMDKRHGVRVWVRRWDCCHWQPGYQHNDDPGNTLGLME